MAARIPLLIRVFSLATAIVVIGDSLLAGGMRLTAALVDEQNPALSPYPTADETTPKARSAAPPGSDAMAVVDTTAHIVASMDLSSLSSLTIINNSLVPEDVSLISSSEIIGTQTQELFDTTATRDRAAYLGAPLNLYPSHTVVTGAGPPTDFMVAFIGDQGPSSSALAVLSLILSEGADMVLHQGDLDYEDDPAAWNRRITDVLGSDFPYFASIGNHDTGAWAGYQQQLADRLARIPDATCAGDLGVKSSCSYRGLFFILSGVGTKGIDHESYIRSELAHASAIWRICSWHKNQRKMQIGGKNDGTGWDVYEICRENGAIIATAHEHSYARTKTLISMQGQVIDPDWPHPEQVRVAAGASFVFVSGLAGKSVRRQKRCLPSVAPYGCNGEWASIYTSQQGATHGALFCSFNVGGQANRARCYFKDIGGVVADEFTIVNMVDTNAP